MKAIIKIYSLVILLLVIGSCGRSGKETISGDSADGVNESLIHVTAEQFSKNQMEVGQPIKHLFRKKVQVNGVIDVPPQNRAVVSIPLGGYITHTTLLVGDQVKRGQVIATLENPEFLVLQQNYLETKEQLPYLKAEYERHQQLYKENITSQKNYLKAEADYRKAMASYEGLRQQLGLLHIPVKEVEAGRMSPTTHIYAPIDGSISKMNITKGAYVSPATEVVEIINTDHIHLELAVFEKDVIYLKEGQEIFFQIPEATEISFQGKVYRIGSAIDENRRVLVHGHIDRPEDFRFIKGMFVEAWIVTDTVRRMALPEDAVVASGNAYYALKLKEEKDGDFWFEAMPLDVFETEEGWIAVGPEERIKEDDRFLTKGAFGLIGSY